MPDVLIPTPMKYPILRLLRCCWVVQALCLCTAALALDSGGNPAPSRPNILWITSEDNGPHLGAYGDSYAATPHLDALAARGTLYRRAWSVSPVCAPARTAIISGLYPSSAGAEHMRSMVELPENMPLYPQYLRDAGYYCTNNSKEDYNLQKRGTVWDDSSRAAHWKNRAAEQPFFAIFNHTVTHESQIRARPHQARHDPAKVRLPAYHPDTPEVRQDWAQYYDKITEMDALAGENLRELEEAGLAEETIIFYFGDHGAGLPRSKRWPYNSGLQVPLIVYIPEKFRHLAPSDYRAGGESDRPIAFVDFAPTLLSLAGIRPPEWLQGEAFLGPHRAPPGAYLFGQRGRMDERIDLVRSVRDERYIYIRNYMPHRIYGQHLAYMFETPTTQVWADLHRRGKLGPPQSNFWETKPAEELYDLAADPDEVVNLANSPDHRAIKERLHQALSGHLLSIRDLGFLSEDELHRRSRGMTAYEMGCRSDLYPLEAILSAAELASSGASTDQLRQLLNHADSAVRYWAVTGLLIAGAEAVTSCRAELETALSDSAPSVRIVAAEALGHFGDASKLAPALAVLIEAASLERESVYTAIAALNSLDHLGAKAAPLRDAIATLPTGRASTEPRMASYVPRLIDRILSQLPSAR